MFGPRGERVREWQASLNGYGVFDQFRGAFDEMQPWRDTLRFMRDHAITNEIMAKMFRVKESADLYQFSIAHVPATWSMNEDEFKLR